MQKGKQRQNEEKSTLEIKLQPLRKSHKTESISVNLCPMNAYKYTHLSALGIYSNVLDN